MQTNEQTNELDGPLLWTLQLWIWRQRLNSILLARFKTKDISLTEPNQIDMNLPVRWDQLAAWTRTWTNGSGQSVWLVANSMRQIDCKVRSKLYFDWSRCMQIRSEPPELLVAVCCLLFATPERNVMFMFTSSGQLVSWRIATRPTGDGTQSCEHETGLAPNTNKLNGRQSTDWPSDQVNRAACTKSAQSPTPNTIQTLVDCRQCLARPAPMRQCVAVPLRRGLPMLVSHRSAESLLASSKCYMASSVSGGSTNLSC